jgi:hypothetical protein
MKFLAKFSIALTVLSLISGTGYLYVGLNVNSIGEPQEILTKGLTQLALASFLLISSIMYLKRGEKSKSIFLTSFTTFLLFIAYTLFYARGI